MKNNWISRRFRKKFTYPINSTGERLERLRIEIDTLQKGLEKAEAKYPKDYGEIHELQMQIDSKVSRLSQVREWYTAALLEGLKSESWALKWLAIALIALTVILTIFTARLVGIRLW